MSDKPAPSLPVAGDAAPELVLLDDTGAIRDLAGQRGHWVVLFFYPKDFTPGCTREVCDFRDHHDEIAAAGATVWSVSILGSASKAKFKAQYGLDYPLLADEDHAVSERYGVWVEKQGDGEAYMGIARTTFLVDPDGRVARVWPSVAVDGHAAEVLEALRARAAKGDLAAKGAEAAKGDG